MTTAYPVYPHDPAPTELVRYFDRALIDTDPVRTTDRFAIEAKARRDRAALIGEMLGAGIAWLWRRVTHLGDTRSPPRAFDTDTRAHA